ncbi:hypothetical protein P3J6_120200 [Pseudoalteromonas sp. 3J6]|uniref:hypothetical protein n=1 Tax=Pseudoalteromonas sp. 3J6 TaxID=649161 RepID=UPI001774A0FB|nr:hypothetical protein [Pseudoalteromonas sp. 3J6]CAD2224372.1 hypothetical protein P3J6_120200 [Pseudoalteromonas sp. 3J6]
MSNGIQNVGIGITADILTAADFGATNFIVNVGNNLLTKIFKDRAEKAREIALNEMKRCERSEFDIESADQFVAIVYRYQRAALEGTALLNLSILAKIMRGQATEGSVFATEFNEFAEIIASLKTREIVYLGTLIRLHKEKILVPKDNSEEYYEIDQSVGILMRKELVGTSHFPESRDLISCETSLQRTAFIYPSVQLIGGTIFSPTSDLERLAELVEFEELFGEMNA